MTWLVIVALAGAIALGVGLLLGGSSVLALVAVNGLVAASWCYAIRPMLSIRVAVAEIALATVLAFVAITAGPMGRS